MANTIQDIPFHYERGVWLANFYSSFGMMEVVLGGTKEAANQQQLAALERIAPVLDEAISRVRYRLGWRRFFYRPIRIAINQQNRVGIQFRNKFTGRQGEVLFVD